MKKHFLITANAGTGKSTIARQLQKMGHEAYDLEEIPGLCGMYKKGTREPFEKFNNGSKEDIADGEWICDTEKLQNLMVRQKKDVAFYAIASNNLPELIPLFDKVFLLIVSKETIYKRLYNREGQDDMGGNEESRQAVLHWKDWWENEIRKFPITEINAEGTPEEITKVILKNI